MVGQQQPLASHALWAVKPDGSLEPRISFGAGDSAIIRSAVAFGADGDGRAYLDTKDAAYRLDGQSLTKLLGTPRMGSLAVDASGVVFSLLDPDGYLLVSDRLAMGDAIRSFHPTGIGVSSAFSTVPGFSRTSGAAIPRRPNR